MCRFALAMAIAFLAAPDIPMAGAPEHDPVGVYWIFLKDKGPDIQTRLVQFQDSLPERTIARRRKAIAAETVVDINDLSVYKPYSDSLAGYLIKTREESRWLNAVSAELKESDIPRIKDLAFVTDLQPVRRSDPQSIEVEVTETWEAGETDFTPSPASLDYGPSFRQLEQIDVIWAHEQGYHGEGILICYLDSGFLTYHHAFNQMNIVDTYDFANDDDFVGYDPAQDEPEQPNHGTGTLGTIGGYYPGQLIGPAFAASYILCKTEVTSSETAVEEDYYVAALEWGEYLGADLASSSLSYKDWYTISDFDGQTCVTTMAANIAFAKGMILCSSMGNEGPGRFTLGAPADSRYSLGIGAVTSDGELARFSSWGPTADGRIKPDICAQGVATIAATPYTTDGFGKWNGTSLSCPLAAGVVALVIQAHPDWSPSRVKEAILESADKANRPDIRFGWGIVNARDAINYPSFSGYVIDKGNSRGVIAQIFLTDKTQTIPNEISISSDSSGYFLAPNLGDGEYTYTVTCKGVAKSKGSIIVPPSEEIDLIIDLTE